MSKQTIWPQYDVLGVKIDAVTITDATDYIVEQAANPATPAFYVAKPYSEFIDGVAKDPKLGRYLAEAQLCLPDGVALCWATVYSYGGKKSLLRIITTGARLVFRPSSAYQFLPQKFAGANATTALLEAAEKASASVFLIGSPHTGTIEHTAGTMRRLFPNLKIVGTAPGRINAQSGPALASALENGADISDLVELISSASPDIILVGMGFPLQEILMSRLSAELKHGALIGEGGTFDYRVFGGRQPRAPKTVQTLGLEWLWRLVLNPRRIKRQLAIPRLIWRVYRAGR